jgi:aspartyl/asparaginyl beta-hydroxylase (cupin superfamily)
LDDGYDDVVDMTTIFGEHWREAWNAGDCIVIDETMVGWVGVTSGRL